MKVRDRIVELKRVRASDLIPNPKNWRSHPEAQADALKGILAEVGYAGAALAYPTPAGLKLIDGHLRAETTPDMEIPVLVLDVTDDEADKLLATFDPLSAMAGQNSEKLEALLAGVKTESVALEEMLKGLASPVLPTAGAGGDEFDASLADAGPTRTQVGEVWLLGGKHRLFVGDCTQPENVSQLMGGELATVLATDPPYSVAYVDKARDMNRCGYVHSRSTLAAAIAGDEIDEAQAELIWRGSFKAALENAVTDTCAWYVWHAPGRATRTLLNVMNDLGMLHHQTLIWNKNNFVIGRCDYQWKHEPCWYGWKQGGRPEYYGPKNQTTVWDVGRDQATEHPTQKPIALFEPPILNHTKPDEIVYDCFSGSGPVLVAAHRHGRRAFLCELAPARADVILKRAEAEGLTVERAENG